MKIKKVKKIIAELEKENNEYDYSIVKGLEVIKLNTRKFAQFDFDFTNSKNIEIPIIKDEDIENCIVKISIRINQEDLYKINLKEFESNIREKCFILKPIIPVIQKIRRVKNKELTNDLGPIEALEVWLLNKKHKDSEEILKLSKEIIREEGFLNDN